MTEKDKIDENLRNLLKNSDSSAPFRTPPGYFGNFPDQMTDLVNRLPDFEQSAAFNPYSVPQNYFEKLPSQINETVLASERLHTSRKNSLKWIFRPSVSLPSLISLTLIVSAFFFFNKRHFIETSAYSGLRIEEYNTNIVLQEIDEATLFDVLTDDPTETGSLEESYEDYLIDNNIDISTIERKL